MLLRRLIFIAFVCFADLSQAQISCFEAANQYRSKYLEQTSIDFDTLSHHLRKGDNMLVGCTFPNDTIVDLNDRQHTIESYRGKVLIVNFWSIHCPPCVNEIESFHSLQKKYSKVAILAATLDKKEELKTWLQKHSFKSDIVPEGISFVHKYSLGNGYPFTIVIDPKGRIIHTRSGGETGKEHQMDLLKDLSPIVEKALSRQ